MNSVRTRIAPADEASHTVATDATDRHSREVGSPGGEGPITPLRHCEPSEAIWRRGCHSSSPPKPLRQPGPVLLQPAYVQPYPLQRLLNRAACRGRGMLLEELLHLFPRLRRGETARDLHQPHHGETTRPVPSVQLLPVPFDILPGYLSAVLEVAGH